jgi:hypothetical protein
VCRQNGAANFGAVVVDKDPMPINNIDVWPLLKEIGNRGERSRKQDVVAVEVGHDVAINFCEACVDGIRLSLVGDASPTDLVAIAL